MIDKDFYTKKRIEELMKPIESQIMLCETREDLLLLACSMLASSKRILDVNAGEEVRKLMMGVFTE
jgi:hypothetical protein